MNLNVMWENYLCGIFLCWDFVCFVVICLVMVLCGNFWFVYFFLIVLLSNVCCVYMVNEMVVMLGL